MFTLCLIVVSDVEKASMQHYKVYQSSFSSVCYTLPGQFGNCPNCPVWTVSVLPCWTVMCYRDHFFRKVFWHLFKHYVWL